MGNYRLCIDLEDCSSWSPSGSLSYLSSFLWEFKLTKSLMLFHGTLVDDCNHALFKKVSEYLSSSLLAFKKHFSSVVCAHNYNAEIRRVIMYVNVKEKFLWNSRDAYWCPSLTILHRRVGIDVIQQDSDISYKMLNRETVYLRVSCLLSKRDL